MKKEEVVTTEIYKKGTKVLDPAVLDLFTDLKAARALPKGLFIAVYEHFNSDRAFSRAIEGRINRSSLTNTYKKLTMVFVEETRTCKGCGIEYKHTPKSHRDSTKYCRDCKSDMQAKRASKRFKGKPSHRRMASDNPQVLKDLTPYLEPTYFSNPQPNAEDKTMVDLTCACGEVVTLRVKQVRQQPYAVKKSCGCKSGNSRHSRAEYEIFQFLTEELNIPENEIQCNTKPDFMGGLELDLYLPNHKLAIEYHGLAFHSERPIFGEKDPKKTKYQHVWKFDFAQKAEVKLIQIFEDEWREKKELLKAMIKARLGLGILHVGARKTELKEVSSFARTEFFEENHIAGDVQASFCYGLYWQGELVLAVSIRKPFTKGHDNVWEIARFATKKGLIIQGGFSKVLKEILKQAEEKGIKSILTYSDCRFGTGNVYEKAGFAYTGRTNPNYFYEKQGDREQRFKHRKEKPAIFARKYPNLGHLDSEKEQQTALGWFKVYDAGSERFLLQLAEKD